MAEIPFDIWETVAGHLDTSDLARFSLVSSTFASLIRPHLYRDLRLFSDGAHNDKTVSLLLSTAISPSTVRQLELVTLPALSSYLGEPSWVNAQIFTKMHGLESLTFSGCPFPSRESQLAFVREVRSHCPALRSLSCYYLPHGGTHSFTDSPFAIPNLKQVEWNHPLPLYSGIVPSIVQGSLTTITHISMNIVIESYDIRSSGPFFSLLFPNLVSFSIGAFVDPDDSEGETLLTQFLLAHPRLQSLRLGTLMNQDDAWATDLNRQLLAPNMFNHLKRLECDWRVLLSLGVADLHLPALTFLTTFALDLLTHSLIAVPLLMQTLRQRKRNTFPLVKDLEVVIRAHLGRSPEMALFAGCLIFLCPFVETLAVFPIGDSPPLEFVDSFLQIFVSVVQLDVSGVEAQEEFAEKVFREHQNIEKIGFVEAQKPLDGAAPRGDRQRVVRKLVLRADR